MDETLERIQKAISRRQNELNRLAELLAKRAKRNGWAASGAKVVIVLLGAISATKASADQIFGGTSIGATTVYVLLGVVIAATAGVTAAFNFEHRANELTQLAAEAWAALREADSQWRRSVAVLEGQSQSRMQGALDLVERQDKQLADIQSRAARLGINVALDLPELLEPEPYRA